MNGFQYLPSELFDRLSFDVLETKTIYKNPRSLTGRLFWSRLTTTIKFVENYHLTGSVLELGCGSGLLLPSLSSHFEKVVGVDLNIGDAELVKNEMSLNNIELVNNNILDYKHSSDFDLIIANDVLEHIYDLKTVIEHLHSLLFEDGHILFTVPTENWLYQLSRLILRVKKPEDHYHTAQEIIDIANGYFEPARIKYLPFGIIKEFAFFALYLGRKEEQ